MPYLASRSALFMAVGRALASIGPHDVLRSWIATICDGRSRTTGTRKAGSAMWVALQRVGEMRMTVTVGLLTRGSRASGAILGGRRLTRPDLTRSTITGKPPLHHPSQNGLCIPTLATP